MPVTTKDSVLGDRDSSSCGSDSFMLRDGVCDEATNHDVCLFDGGDCCLEFKDTTLCKECSCILSVDFDKLHAQFHNMSIKALLDLGPQMDYIFNTNTALRVSDVVSKHVCAVLCLDHENSGEFNAWQYNNALGSCNCGWLGSHQCLEKTVDNSDSWLNDGSLKNMPHDHMYVQLKKTVPCCE